MESKSVRKIDVINIIKYLIKKLYIVIIIAVLFAGMFGGKKYFDYKVQLKNELFYNANKKDLVYGAFVIYINNYDGSENYYNRIEDITAIVKGYGSLDKLMKDNNINVTYTQMYNSVAAIPVGMNQLEISIEGAYIGLNQEQVVEVTKDFCDNIMTDVNNYFGEGSIILIEETHAKAYELEKALTMEEKEEKITKKSVVLNGIVGGMIGAVIGAVTVMFYVLLSTILRTKNEVIECYGMSLLGSVDKEGKDREEYKRVLKRIANRKSLAMVSISDKEYRNEAVANLAECAAVNGKTAVVIKISADVTGVENNSLYQYIEGKKSLKDMLVNTSRAAVKNIEWTQATTEEVDLFTHERFACLMEEIKSSFDYVLVDCPSFKASAATLNIVGLCDDVMVVASCGNIREEEVNLLRYNFRENNIDCLGVLYIQ